MKKYFLWLAAITGLILAIPLVAMQYSAEVQWTAFDFIFAGALIFGIGSAYYLVASRMNNPAYRMAVGLGLGGAFLLIWANGAVGIIGSEDNAINGLYFAVLATGFLGAIIARFKPLGMARVMFTAAAIQFAVPIIALIIFQNTSSAENYWGTSGILSVFILNSFFVMLFAGSGILFKQSDTTALEKAA